jgi:hypothetical protein
MPRGQGFRFFAASAASAVVLFVGAGIVNGALLGAEWSAWVKALGGLSHAPSPAVGMLLWVVVSLVFGTSGLWIHAAVRPRYPTRRAAAFRAGACLWAAGFLAPAIGQLALGAIPTHIVVVDCAGSVVSVALALLAGAAVYGQ